MIVFVSDLFVKDYVGGGELSTQALIETSLMPVAQINSRFLTVEIMSQYPNAFWILATSQKCRWIVWYMQSKTCRIQSLNTIINFVNIVLLKNT